MRWNVIFLASMPYDGVSLRNRCLQAQSPRRHGVVPLPGGEFWRAQEPLMLMCETPYAEIVKVLESAGARVIEVEEDSRADATLVFCYYVARKE